MSNQSPPDYPTDDPILLEALFGVPANPPGARGSSRYRGVSKNTNAKSTTWSASISWGPKHEGHSYALGTYKTEEEAALARNYADELLKRPNPVRNVIPPDVMPNETTRKRVAETVVQMLRAKGALQPTPAKPTPQVQSLPAQQRPGQGGQDAGTASPIQPKQPIPAQQRPGQGGQDAGPAKPTPPKQPIPAVPNQAAVKKKPVL